MEKRDFEYARLINVPMGFRGKCRKLKKKITEMARSKQYIHKSMFIEGMKIPNMSLTGYQSFLYVKTSRGIFND